MVEGLNYRHFQTLKVLKKMTARISSDFRHCRGKPIRLLDLGCGTGNFSIVVARLLGVDEVYGVDIDEHKLRIAEGKGIVTVLCDLNSCNIPYPKNYFDFVTAFDVLEHITYIDHCLKEVYRVLKADGLFIITTPNIASLWGRLELLLGRYPWGLEYSFETMRSRSLKAKGIKRVKPAGHVRGFTLWALEDLLDFHGFEIIYSTGFNVSILSYYKPLLPLTWIKKTLRGHLLVVAKKKAK